MEIYLPEILCSLHDLWYFTSTHKNEEIKEIQLYLERYQTIYEIIHPSMIRLFETKPQRTSTRLLKLIPFIQSHSQELQMENFTEVIKHGWTPAFLVLICMYYRVPLKQWIPLIRQCTPPFQKIVRTIAIYLRNQELCAQFLLTPYTPWDTLASCLGSQDKNPLVYLTQQEDNKRDKASSASSSDENTEEE